MRLPKRIHHASNGHIYILIEWRVGKIFVNNMTPAKKTKAMYLSQQCHLFVSAIIILNSRRVQIIIMKMRATQAKKTTGRSAKLGEIKL